MNNMPMCPMMMHNMPMMQMPMMQPMNMQHEDDVLAEDERDDEYFAGMYGENCHRMMPYVMKAVDRMEKKGDMLYAEYPDREMIDRMTEETYGEMMKEMPEMAKEMGEERQYFGPRRLARDLLGVLLLGEISGRRRRRRRRPYGGFPGYGYGSGDFYYND